MTAPAVASVARQNGDDIVAEVDRLRLSALFHMHGEGSRRAIQQRGSDQSGPIRHRFQETGTAPSHHASGRDRPTDIVGHIAGWVDAVVDGDNQLLASIRADQGDGFGGAGSSTNDQTRCRTGMIQAEGKEQDGQTHGRISGIGEPKGRIGMGRPS